MTQLPWLEWQTSTKHWALDTLPLYQSKICHYNLQSTVSTDKKKNLIAGHCKFISKSAYHSDLEFVISVILYFFFHHQFLSKSIMQLFRRFSLILPFSSREEMVKKWSLVVKKNWIISQSDWVLLYISDYPKYQSRQDSGRHCGTISKIASHCDSDSFQRRSSQSVVSVVRRWLAWVFWSDTVTC